MFLHFASLTETFSTSPSLRPSAPVLLRPSAPVLPKTFSTSPSLRPSAPVLPKTFSTGDGGAQVAQRGGQSEAGAFQKHVAGGRVWDATVQTQREGKVLAVTQQLVPQVRS
ncbi:hypothetical protein EYF80_057757 [Liparis tanakae]|uniref:Uncharacterized protein n=1 Tax=Liparis tanakae TaxID=230148 RepID=A0A4Z2ETA9_9TELE|nr:hypothetical protein EYF80_057757 [Liparis tanakae]